LAAAAVKRSAAFAAARPASTCCLNDCCCSGDARTGSAACVWAPPVDAIVAQQPCQGGPHTATTPAQRRKPEGPAAPPPLVTTARAVKLAAWAVGAVVSHRLGLTRWADAQRGAAGRARPTRAMCAVWRGVARCGATAST
jgi:hypothetical protein